LYRCFFLLFISIDPKIQKLGPIAFYCSFSDGHSHWAEHLFRFFLVSQSYVFSIDFFNPKKNIKGLYLSGVATFIALVFSQLDSIMTSESGGNSEITSLELGYYLWCTSFFILTLGTAINVFRKDNNPTRSELR